jgi:hypothetical protein
MGEYNLSHLRALEAESIHIIREVAAEFQKPVMLYSVGKDSSVMVRLAQKAFHPGKIPFPLLPVDTTYKFQEMIEFRDKFCAEIGIKLIVHTNTKAIEEGKNVAVCSRRGRCSMPCRRAVSMWPSAERAGMKRSRGPGSGSIPFAIPLASGTPRTSVPSCGICSTAASITGRASGYFRC